MIVDNLDLFAIDKSELTNIKHSLVIFFKQCYM